MKNKILYVVSALFGLFFINAGLNKFFNYMPMPTDMPAQSVKDMGAMMEIAWLMPLVAVAEIIGGLLIIFPKTRALGAAIIFPLMVGILLANYATDPGTFKITLPLTAILIWILLDNRKKYAAMIGE